MVALAYPMNFGPIESFLLRLLKLVAQIEDVWVVEGHMVPVATEHNQMVLENYARVPVSRRRALAFHMVNLCITRPFAPHNRRTFIISHWPTHRLSFTHLLVIAIEVRSIVVLDQERSLHMIWSWRIQTDLLIILERLSLLQERQSIHRANAARSCTWLLGCTALVLACISGLTIEISDRSIEFWVEVVSVRACLGTITILARHATIRIQAVLLL